MPRNQVHYFFAFPSPYAALADWRIDDLVAGAGGELAPVPVVPRLPQPRSGLETTLREFRVSYGAEDARRWAERIGMPWVEQPPGPVDSTDAAVGWYFARDGGAERGYRNAVFRARWCQGRDIADQEVLADCAEGAGLDRAAFLEALRQRRHHDEIPKALQRCMQERVFGVPFFVVDGRHFWGNDRIDFLLEELAKS